MGQMQNKAHGVESVKETIRSIEDNSQMREEGTLKQTVVQDVKNTKVSGEGCLGGSYKSWGGSGKY